MEIENDNPLEPTGPPTMGAPVSAPMGQTPGAEPEGDKAQIKAQAHRLVTRGIELLHSPETRDAVAAAVANNVNVVKGIADQAKAIIQRVDAMSRREGVELDLEARMYGGKDLVDEIAEIAEAETGQAIEQDDRDLAFSVSVQDYLKEEIKAGRVDPAELKAGAQESLKSLPKEEQQAANDQMLRIDAAASKLKAGGQQVAAGPEGEMV